MRIIRNVALAASVLASPLAQAQGYPEKPVRIIVVYAPGGGADVQGRIAAQRLGEILKQPFVIENRTGAAGNIGTAAAARAAPDGYTLLLATVATVTNPHLFKNAGYDARRDFTGVVPWAWSPLLVLAHPSFPAKDLRELVTYVRANPGKVDFASGGTGAVTHLQMELLKDRAGVPMQHIVYQGQAPAVNAVAGGHVPLMADSVASGLPFVRTGRLRALAITSPQRWPGAPDIATADEQGFADLANLAWYGLLAPAGTPEAVQRVLYDASRKALAMPETQKQLEAVGATGFAQSREDFVKFLDEQGTRWAKVVRDNKISAD